MVELGLAICGVRVRVRLCRTCHIPLLRAAIANRKRVKNKLRLVLKYYVAQSVVTMNK